MLKRTKRRYLALAIDSHEAFGSNEFMDAVWASVLKLYGEYGASRANLNLIEYDEEERFAVVRTGHVAVEMVRAALASITRIGNKRVAVHILAISGTIKALHRKARG